ncbi:hypothetical protein HK104_008231 [Borealophlyctis nickersoniae]|nr:hypothetical protein HK104_008231 [Borealophlyctis nickersoniae]
MKRKRRTPNTEAKDGTEQRDKAPKGGDSDAQAGLPRKFRKVLAIQKFAKEKATARKQQDKTPTIDEGVREALNAVAKATSKTQQKRKAWLAERKAKANSRRTNEEDDEKDLPKDVVKFGTAQAIKQLQAVLNKAESNKAAESEDDAGDASRDEPAPVRRKRKLKTLPEVERKAIMNEREKLIAAYRSAKASRQSAAP